MNTNTNNARLAHDYILELAAISMKLADIKRAPRYISGQHENDAEHSYLLAISATEIAASFYPNLDSGLVTQYSLVHDLAEIYTGDVVTINISDEDRAKKELDEKEATNKLVSELPPHTAQLLQRYEQQVEPEARFVRLIDKLMPTVVNILASDIETFKREYDIATAEILNQKHTEYGDKLKAMFPEFDFIREVRDLISETSIKSIFGKK